MKSIGQFVHLEIQQIFIKNLVALTVLETKTFSCPQKISLSYPIAASNCSNCLPLEQIHCRHSKSSCRTEVNGVEMGP